jgi:hypothetical protein
MRRNWCGQCGTPYLDADWRPTPACGPSHAIIARDAGAQVRAVLREPPLMIIGPNVEAHLRDFLTRIIEEQGGTDHVWLVAHATGLLMNLAAARATAPEAP